MTGVDLGLAAVLDIALGDPRWFPHPVRGMGAVIGWIDHRIRTICRSEQALQFAGACLALGLPAAVYGAATWVIGQAAALHPILGQAVGIGLASTTLAGRDLYDHVQAVIGALAAGDLAGARKAVARIVGRDSAALTEPEIARATVETIAESASDGIIAPLVYLSLGGAPLALAYKAVNTLDSMIGHRDERYEHFGWASARLDDVVNWIPARLTGGFIALAAGLSTGQWHRIHESWYILHRDGDKHLSPNSGQPEAAMAGALGVQLGGRNSYDGVPHDAELLGDGPGEVTPEHIGRATRIMLVTYALGLFFALLSLWVS